MTDERDEVAARNNAEWCAAVWRSHGLPMERGPGLWFCPEPTPQFYPNVVTIERGANTADQTRFIAELAHDRPNPGFSVKDSFACLDLRVAGLLPLFEARWLWRADAAIADDGEPLDWRRIGDERELAVWEHAWRSGQRDAQRIFLPALLADARVAILGGFDAADAVHAGGIAFDAADVLGITNIFGSRRQFVGALASLMPAKPMMGYESGDDLTAAMKSGFEPLGPLQVWVRGA